ncbi:LLM class flavin-dependent oxidoreductase [Actinomadura meridiana]|uniref:LLM class flavin-dependent oxidoreductase n=1 Tax=Actinomadura meridiana TaxID=559626 RepID=A0ABP8CEU8_9ACTN
MDFSLFYFSDDGAGAPGRERYRLLLDGARFADRHGFTAVWTPERHFHPFGGIYPNPSVAGAAVAAITEHVEIRAGSVVAPLHHPVRLAEEWAVVDNLSDGRVSLSFAPGWHATDFVLAPDNYSGRRDVMAQSLDTVRRLWRRETVELTDGSGERAEVRIYPAPVQPELPIWLTSAGSPDTFRAAGTLGAGLLTHLLGQDIEDLAKKIAIYRAAYTGDGAPRVALMLHTFLGEDREAVREIVRTPFSEYIRSSIGLIARASGDLLPDVDPADLDPEDVDFLVRRSFDRYFDTGGLFGRGEDAAPLLETLTDIGVDEVACLIDFGVDTTAVLDGLGRLATLKDIWQRS